jgi:hypothetical protein
MSSIDTNVDNYTIPELLAILNLDDPNRKDIIDATNTYIYDLQKQSQPIMAIFFKNIQQRLLEYMDNLEQGQDDEYDPDNIQTNDWYTSQYLAQSDPVQTNKITDREQKIDVYNDQHMPMKQEQLGVSNTYNTEVAQDKLNPNLKNVTNRLMVLDSQFRQASGTGDSFATDYTLELSDPLTDVLSIRLYSFQIPYTWYVFDYAYGNTCFWLILPGDALQSIRISINPGSYSTSQFTTELNNAFYRSKITNTDGSQATIVTYNSTNGKFTIDIDGLIFTDPETGDVFLINGIHKGVDQFDHQTNPYFIFFDYSGQLSPTQDGFSCNSQNFSFSTSLGWMLGFRLPVEPIFVDGNIPICIADISGAKYFIIVLDDYNQNHINNGLVTITETPSKISLPSYYVPTQPIVCSPSATYVPDILQIQSLGELANLTSAQAAALGINLENIGNIIQSKSSLSTDPLETIITTQPRTLTQAQIYTINQAIKSRAQNTYYGIKPPNVSDTFGLVPLKTKGLSIGDVYVEFSGSLQDSKRVYFGPVNIEKIRLKLIDDKGFLVNLNGVDWSITIITENLYQY